MGHQKGAPQICVRFKSPGARAPKFLGALKVVPKLGASAQICGRRYNSLHFVTFRHNLLHYDSLRFITTRYTSLHFVTIRYITTCYDSLRPITIRYDSLHFVTFRYDSLHYDPLRFVTNGLKWFEMY